ncbi:hypothetical protein ACWGKX_29945, partial [Streptomyces tricolor]
SRSSMTPSSGCGSAAATTLPARRPRRGRGGGPARGGAGGAEECRHGDGDGGEGGGTASGGLSAGWRHVRSSGWPVIDWPSD